MILAQALDTSLAWVSRHVWWAPPDTMPSSTSTLSHDKLKDMQSPSPEC